MRVDQYNVTVSINFQGNNYRLGTFDKMSGGRLTSNDVKFRPGNMGPQISLGGWTSVEDVTVQRLWTKEFLTQWQQLLINANGIATITVVKQALDQNGNVAGMRPIVYRGRLKDVKFPDPDAEATTAGLLELICSVDGNPQG